MLVTGDNDLNCVGPDAAFHHQLELQDSHDEEKARPRGHIYDTNPLTPKATTLQLKRLSTPEQDSTAPTPENTDVLDPARLRDAVFAKQSEQALRLLALGQEA